MDVKICQNMNINLYPSRPHVQVFPITTEHLGKIRLHNVFTLFINILFNKKKNVQYF